MTIRLAGGLLAITALGGAGLAAPEPEAVTRTERAGLREIHRYAVKLFIDRNGFGLSRIDPPLTDVLGPPKSKGDASRQPVVENPLAIRAGKNGKAAHFSFAKAVGEAAYISPTGRGKAWVVKDVQLVGLVKHPDPVVYLTGDAKVTGGRTRRPAGPTRSRRRRWR